MTESSGWSEPEPATEPATDAPAAEPAPPTDVPAPPQPEPAPEPAPEPEPAPPTLDIPTGQPEWLVHALTWLHERLTALGG